MSLIGAWEGKLREGDPSNILIHNGDIVEAQIINITYSHRHVKEVDENNAKVDEIANKTGVRKGEQIYTYKEGGVSLELAILSKTDDDGIYTDFSDDLISKKELYSSIIMLPPDKFKERGFDFKHERTGGKIIKGNDGNFVGILGTKDGNVIIDDIYPSVNELTYFENRKPVKKASEITDDDLNDETIRKGQKYSQGQRYQFIIENERKRQEEWEQLLRSWDNQTEQQAKDFLLLALSSRLLIHDVVKKPFMPYYYPKVGMKLKLRAERQGKYVNYVAFSGYGNDREFYSEGVHPVTDEDVTDAENLLSKRALCWAT